MSGYILCQVPRSKVPYYIENISTNIYSLEELCYYFHHNLYLLDDTILCDELLNWIKEELGLVKLYQKIKSAVAQGDGNVRDYVYPIFKEINYLSYEEMKQYENKVVDFQKENTLSRMKMKGDNLVESGMYVNALKVYHCLLEEYRDSQEVEHGFLGSVYHNAGCAYSFLFQREDALGCFEKAYELLHTGVSLRSYLYAFYTARTPIEFNSKMEELRVDDQTRQEVLKTIEGIQNSDQPAIPEHQIDSMLEQMTKDYHRSTGN